MAKNTKVHFRIKRCSSFKKENINIHPVNKVCLNMKKN